jgi:serine/threonine-protein kinase
VVNIQVVEILGEGANGIVFGSYDTFLDRPVALKVYPQRISRGNVVKFRERVMHEIRKAATLKHPGIAAVYRGDILDNGWPFIVMERSPGTSLRECRDELPRKSPSGRSYLLGAVYQALTHAKDRKILHGDLHFGNVILLSEIPSMVRLERRSEFKSGNQSKSSTLGRATSLAAETPRSGTPGY